MADLPLLGGNTISLEDALIDDDNILHRLDYPQKLKAFCSDLLTHQHEIESLVSFHLCVKHCQVADEEHWLFGSYNVCIPVYIGRQSEERVLFRVPLPFKIGEESFPGNTEEKLRCEVATYIWIRENCPDVPIPSLYGFGFSNGRTFAQENCIDLFTRWHWRIKRSIQLWFGWPKSCSFVRTGNNSAIKTGYMIISFVKSGRMLSDTWKEYLLTDKTRRHTLFSDIAKIMITLSRIQFPRIGSLSLDDDGLINLTNRPLTLRLQTLENEGIPTIPRSSTYQCVEPYILDLLHCHDNRIHYQPNAIHDLKDGQEQLSALTMMKGLLPQFISHRYRDGPFIFSLTDIHPSNIFVDKDWHITSLIDLEWACIFPIELQTPPYWLTGRPIDDIEDEEHLQKFQEVMTEFIDAFEEQEQRLQSSAPTRTEIMRKCWERGSFWYFQALHSPKGMLRVFNGHIQRIFCEEHCTQRVFDRTVSPYWTPKAEEFIQAKVIKETEYKNQLRKRFSEEDKPCTSA